MNAYYRCNSLPGTKVLWAKIWGSFGNSGFYKAQTSQGTEPDLTSFWPQPGFLGTNSANKCQSEASLLVDEMSSGIFGAKSPNKSSLPVVLFIRVASLALPWYFANYTASQKQKSLNAKESYSDMN